MDILFCIMFCMKNLPKYKRCFICGKENPIGLNLTFQTDKDKVFVKFTLNEKYIGYKDRIHGGIAASVLDEIMGWACSVKTKRLYYTVELRIRYKMPIKPNIELFAEAYAKEFKKFIGYAKAVLKDDKGNVLALAEGKYFPIDEESEKEIFGMLHHEPEDGKPVTKNDI